MITSIETLNIPGTNTSRHNALRTRRISEANLMREGEVCLNSVKKAFVAGEQIPHKDGCRSTALSQSHRQSLLFDVKYPLTRKNSPPILLSIESNTLSNYSM